MSRNGDETDKKTMKPKKKYREYDEVLEIHTPSTGFINPAQIFIVSGSGDETQKQLMKPKKTKKNQKYPKMYRIS